MKGERTARRMIAAMSVLAILLGALPILAPRLAAAATVLSRTYTLDADFDEGILVGVEHETVHDQLQLSGEVTTYPIMWIANAGEDTVSKWDTDSNVELARYHTWFGPPGYHDAWQGPSPSRTAVDLDGNCYVANRHFDGRPADVIKILADDWIDRDGDGVLDTSYDADSNGTISPPEMLPMTDTNGNGVIDDAEIRDERIAWAVSVGPPGAIGRSLAIDINGNIWLGLWNTRAYYKLSSVDGSILAGPINVSPNTPYGSLVDRYGILWGASLGNTLLKLDTNTNAVLNVYNHGYGGDYGIALGYDGAGNTHVYQASTWGNTYIEHDSGAGTFSIPAALKFSALGVAVDSNGDIFASSASGGPGIGGVAKFRPDGSLIWSASAQVSAEARGTIVDSNDDVWVIHRPAHKLSKFKGSDGTPLGVFNAGRYPYTYSDATGLGLRSSIVAFGTWTVVFDSESADTPWGNVSWNSDEPAGTSVTVKVRSSNDGSSWSAWETATNGVDLSATPDGQYLQIETTLQITSGDVSPILYDLTAQVGNQPPVADANGPYTMQEDTSITLDGTGSSDPDNNIASYEWDLDDDGEYDDATGPTPTFFEEDPGIYTVALQVCDSYGVCDTDETTVTVTYAPGIAPPELIEELNRGDCIYETKVVNVPPRPPIADIVFSFDLTGSMGGIISTAKARAVDIISDLDALSGVDIQYGVMSYMDYPHTYNSCGYYATYGSAGTGDYAYSLDQSVTDDTTAVSTAINGLTLGWGADGPQDYTRIFYESYADPSVSWRSGAKRILVNFGDNVPHDCNLNEGVTGGTWSTGCDPGRDEIAGNDDDLDLQTVLAEMAANGVVLLEAHTSDWYSDYWTYWTGITGGDVFLTGSSTLVDDIVAAVQDELEAAMVYGLHLEASAGFEDWLVSVSPSEVDVEPGEIGTTVSFDVQICVPLETWPGEYNFTISAVDEDGVSYGDQNVIITAVNQPPTVDADQANVTVDEGDEATNTGTVSDPDGDPVTLSASIGTVINNGDGTWSWSFDTDDGPAESQTVTIYADDGYGGTDEVTFELTVNNVAPTATFNAPNYVIGGDDIDLSLTDPYDPSSADTAAGFEYAFDCDDGSGYSTWSSDNTATCSTDAGDIGSRTVKGKIMDKDGGETEYTALVYILPPSAATDSSLCIFDREPDIDGQQFRLLFTPDMQLWPAYKLPASNPGQFFYNVFYTGEGPASFDIAVPDSFETQGAMPVHVYTAVSVVTVDGLDCFVPDLDSEIYAGDQLSLSDVPVPDGFVYVAVHLDYALKGTTGYGQNYDGDAINAATEEMLIPNLADHEFIVSGSQEDSQTIQNVNEFKRIPGIGGLVLDPSETGIPNVQVDVLYPDGSWLGTAHTDEDGWYMLEYKHKGKKATYTIELPDYGLSEKALLKSNGFVEVSFYDVE